MKAKNLFQIFVLALLVFAEVFTALPVSAKPATAPMLAKQLVVNYQAPCKNGIQAGVTTWHDSGSLDRYAYDWICEGSNEVYAPHNGMVKYIHYYSGDDITHGMVMIYDKENNACITMIHLNSTFSEGISVGKEVTTDTQIGSYTSSEGHTHIAVNPGQCSKYVHANELPIIFTEIGSVLSQKITINGTQSGSEGKRVWVTDGVGGGSNTILRGPIYWDDTYTGNVDASRYEKWTFMFSNVRDFTITAARTSGDVTLRLILLDGNGNELARVDGSELASLIGNRPAGNYAVLVQPVNGSGSYSLRMVNFIEPVVCPANIIGWKAEFFNNRDLSQPLAACRDEAKLDFGWEFNSPDPKVSADNFSARFTRIMNFSAGEHTFYMAGDDGIRLFVDGNILIDKWFDHGITEYPATISLAEGSHTIVAEYYEHTGGATVKLRFDEIHLPSVSTAVNPKSIAVGETSIATVSLANIPAGGYLGAEFTCTYNAALVEVSKIKSTNLFGEDAVTAVNGPQNGSFIFAIVGSKGNKATTNGDAFTFSLKGLQAGETAVECKARVSNRENTLTDISSTGDSLIVDTPPDGKLTGQVLSCKPVTIRLNNIDFGPFPDGAFSLTAPAGTYPVTASAAGFLSAQGSATLTSGNTTPLPIISLLAGDIDSNSVIDQFDAMTIGMGYNTPTPIAADLNCDNTINFFDLELLARNYRTVGPTVWQ